MRIQTWDKKVFDVPEENLEGFLQDYNKATNFDPATLSADPNVNPERGANWAGTARAAVQGLPVIGSYADEAEAWVRSQFGDKSYDEYLKNARESTKGAFKNTPERAYAANIGTGIVGEGILAALSGGASLTPQAQGAMGAIYGYGAGEGNIENRLTDAAIIGGASAALPVAGRYLVKGGKAIINGGKNLITKAGEKMVEKKIPATIQALKKASNPDIGKAALYTNSKGETDINILSTLMEGAEDYPTQAKVATELVKETPKNAGLYGSEIMQSVDDLARVGWKNQIAGAVEDVARNISNPKDQKILAQIADKLSKATKTTIESADNALEEVELKDVREIVNYAIDKFGKDLSKETRDILEKRMISEGMAKRVSNKLVNKSLTESAKIPGWMSIAGDAITYVAGNAFVPGAGALAVIGKNALRGGTGSAIKKYAINKATSNAAQGIIKGTAQKATKQSKGAILNSLLDDKPVAQRLITPFRSIHQQKTVIPKQTKTPILLRPTTYQQPIMQSLIQ